MPYIGPVEHNIPIPKDGRRRHLQPRLTPFLDQLRACAFGDSFVVELTTSHAHTYAARHLMTIATNYDSPGKIRVWRLKDKQKK